jgi:hypothetical protein
MARQIHMITVMTGISLVKISVSLLLLRLVVRRLYVWFLWGVIIFMVAFTLACVGTLGMFLYQLTREMLLLTTM